MSDKPRGPLAVLRPADPAKAIEMSKALLGKSYEEGQRGFNELLNSQPHTFMGLLGKKRTIVDSVKRYKKIGKVKPGDSFVDYAELCRQQEEDSEVEGG